ncbi:deoxyribodipyrimidine photo-lyase [Candidatus Williamhamiltonella defendens]|uniref:deoxyribodipyrimidine photo-lyase n=1 Tax=Candidatus Williamhamiltonella defendens TaxID=138072 RepID=UPI00130E3CC0|nr:deoxyribodipyrimidine photo-lyase [Candidatus Hamiltonella defensa]
MPTHLVWLRHDLRVTDNRALNAACQHSQAKVLVVFIATPIQWKTHHMAPRQAAFLLAHLKAVQARLMELDIPLHYHECDDFQDAVKWLINFCNHHKVDKLFYNYQYEINESRRDHALEKKLRHQVICQGFHDAVLLPPEKVLKDNGQMYQVFTPFRHAFLKQLPLSNLSSIPVPKKRDAPQMRISLTDLSFDYPLLDFDTKLFPIGEAAAQKQLTRFCDAKVSAYHNARNIPAITGTSGLSPYLTLGILSPRQCLGCLRDAFPEGIVNHKGAFDWLNELIWRDFYRHLLMAYPRLSQGHPFIGWTKFVKWHHSDNLFKKWQQGRTGYPIVDAAMRQLNTTGWMHNRLRMITASFLVKDLLIDWCLGEQYFMSQLLDGDLAANNGGWQWAASTGTDAVPYFRIFNPNTQGKRFDPKGEFIRHWLPELSAVPESEIHQPESWAGKNQKNVDYPSPVVDHKQARQATLSAFIAAKNLSEEMERNHAQ